MHKPRKSVFLLHRVNCQEVQFPVWLEHFSELRPLKKENYPMLKLAARTKQCDALADWQGLCLTKAYLTPFGHRLHQGLLVLTSLLDFWILMPEVRNSCGNSMWIQFPCASNVKCCWHLHVVIIRVVVDVGCFNLYHSTSASVFLGMYVEASGISL